MKWTQLLGESWFSYFLSCMYRTCTSWSLLYFLVKAIMIQCQLAFTASSYLVYLYHKITLETTALKSTRTRICNYTHFVTHSWLVRRWCFHVSWPVSLNKDCSFCICAKEVKVAELFFSIFCSCKNFHLVSNVLSCCIAVTQCIAVSTMTITFSVTEADKQQLIWIWVWARPHFALHLDQGLTRM